MLAVAATAALVLSGCSAATSNIADIAAPRDLKSLLPSPNVVISSFDANWSGDSAPREYKPGATMPATSSAGGTKCSASTARWLAVPGAADAAGESFNGDGEPQVIAIYGFGSAAQADAWRRDAAGIGTYCPSEYATDPHAVAISAISDANTSSVGWSTTSENSQRFDLVATSGSIGISVESQSSELDARHLMVLARQALAKSAGR